MYCIGCGKQIDDNAQFCDFCGASQVAVQKGVHSIFCMKCGMRMPENSDFCIYCGAPQGQDVEQKPDSAFCLFCGKPIEKGSSFCMHCGRVQKQAEPTPVQKPESFCIHCGKAIEAGSKFCLHCGMAQQEMPAVIPPPPIVYTAQPAVKKDKTWIIILCAVLGACMVFSFLVRMVACNRSSRYDDYYYDSPSYSYDDDYYDSPSYSYDDDYSSSSSSSSGSSWEDDDDDDFEVAPAPDYSGRAKCGYCDGGRCDECGGDGYVYSSASGKDDRNCPAAHCLNGRCSYCGGDGWVE